MSVLRDLPQSSPFREKKRVKEVGGKILDSLINAMLARGKV